jgi:hypothetical protein
MFKFSQFLLVSGSHRIRASQGPCHASRSEDSPNPFQRENPSARRTGLSADSFTHCRCSPRRREENELEPYRGLAKWIARTESPFTVFGCVFQDGFVADAHQERDEDNDE